MKNLRRCSSFARCLGASALLASAPLSALADQGLVPRSGDWLWPQLQARITLQTAPLAPVALTRTADPALGAVRGVQGGGVYGDYVVTTARFGNFRATSGVMLGTLGGAPVLNAAPTSRLGVTMLDAGYGGNIGSSAADGASTQPYLGLGYSSASMWRSLALSADVGLVAGRAAALGGLGRAVLGSQSKEAAMRDLRLAPVLQLGVQYSF